MAKPKSLKLRTLISLHALYKYSDENHRFTTAKLNEHLRPYGLECSRRVLGETAAALREFGWDIRQKGQWDNQGVWLHNRPLSDSDLNRLVFAVSTNPNLSQNQATDILRSLKPFVTVYQEPVLCGTVDTEQNVEMDDTLYWVYAVVHEAITLRRRVRYTVDYVQLNKETQLPEQKQEWPTLFTPKSIYQSGNGLYMVGYNHPDKRLAAVNLKDVTDIKIAYKHNDRYAEETRRSLEGLVAKDLVPGESDPVVYAGPITFCCKGQYVGELYRRFGPPSEPVQKDRRGRATYATTEAEITIETLSWLERIPGLGIRIAGPNEARAAIDAYFEETSQRLLNPNPLNFE